MLFLLSVCFVSVHSVYLFVWLLLSLCQLLAAGVFSAVRNKDKLHVVRVEVKGQGNSLPSKISSYVLWGLLLDLNTCISVCNVSYISWSTWISGVCVVDEVVALLATRYRFLVIFKYVFSHLFRETLFTILRLHHLAILCLSLLQPPIDLVARCRYVCVPGHWMITAFVISSFLICLSTELIVLLLFNLDWNVDFNLEFSHYTSLHSLIPLCLFITFGFYVFKWVSLSVSCLPLLVCVLLPLLHVEITLLNVETWAIESVSRVSCSTWQITCHSEMDRSMHWLHWYWLSDLKQRTGKTPGKN